MASIQEPEIQFAQRLASNEKHIRTKAVKKLRKYITVRSQKETGGFTGDELLKLWKGLFYCLWMQDKPLLQEELSNQISALIHSFHNIDGQFLYFESFLQTFKREWTGIDRLRMDKFFQLVRLMFRQTFELLKRTSWEKSVVARFLELLTAQLLQSGSGAPTGLQFHILDLYMTELAAVASAELTADQNLVFIEPFCKTAAKTKERTLFRAICNSIFSTIIDQAPFAIEDLMKEVKAAETSDSGQASEEDDEDQLKEKTKSKPVRKKERGKQINGNKSHTKRGDDGQSDDSDDELLHQEDSDTEVPCDDDIGPVLQFDYAALADKLFELASRSNTPSQNRQRLYKIIKLLCDLNEGIFPQDEYPEDVSTDEDDDMFGSRIRMKRGGGDIVQDEDGLPAAKKSKRKKKASILDKKIKDLGTDNNILADCTVNNENQKKKSKKKKKKTQDASTDGEKNAKNSEEEQIVSSIQEAERGPQYLQAEYLEKETQMQSSISSVIVTEAATSDSQSETLLLSEVKKQSSTVREENSQPIPSTTDNKDQSETLSKKKKKRKTSELRPEVTEEVGEHQTPVRTEPEMSTEALALVPGKTKKKKGLKGKIQTDGNVAESQVSEEAEITLENGEVSAEKNKPTLETDSTTPAKKKKKGMKAKRNDEAVEGASQINDVSTEADIPSIPVMDTVEDGLTISFKQITSSAPIKKRRKKNNVKANEVQGVEADAQLKAERKCIEAEITSVGEEASHDTITVPLRKKTKGKQYNTRFETLPAADKSTVTLLMTKRKKDQKESKTVEEAEVAGETPQVANAEKVLFDTTMTTPTKKQKKNQKLAAVELDEIKAPTQLQVVDDIVAELPLNKTKVLSSSGKPAKKKKISVVFEFEADELEAAAQEAASISGLAEEETVAKKTKRGNDVGDPSTTLRTQKSQKKAKNSSTSDFITFQSNAAVPTPIFCKTKGRPGTVLSSKKKSQTPKSESKKVTFGLKNNKTAEFRKTDRSLLVSPAGSSRVAFDPKQKPKFGVLKSLPTPRSASLTTTPSSYRKTSLSTPKSTPKQRPSAADFF
ncbi:hypothetical protein L3Q82_017817 [Scortum barcoo]|uniref:Uncharacterized protein n=1 Tax=Scortum barcoo TaxID=214431 RepID=A0ACB8VLX8_9TELE|nr:hypothetical protein L3Q82_017817 [Scortum barcoo]